MPITTNMTVEAGAPSIWVPAYLRGPQLKPSAGTTHTHETDAQALAEADWVYLQIVLMAYQIHPMTVGGLDAFGPIGGRNFLRWTSEGPTSLLPGETANCSIRVDVAHSLTATAGSDWREHDSGRHKLRSFKARVVVTRPDTTYDFRIVRFGVQATVNAPPMPDRLGERWFDGA